VRRVWAGLSLLVLVAVAGCATTRRAAVGPLPNSEPLVTLIVTKESDLVQHECRPSSSAVRAGPSLGIVRGCQRSHAVTLPGGAVVRALTIVRYTDVLPSPLAFEIDVHELCHAVASLQALDDPCHIGNGGVLRAAARP
jgi:hypothetical protein